MASTTQHVYYQQFLSAKRLSIISTNSSLSDGICSVFTFSNIYVIYVIIYLLNQKIFMEK